MFTIAEIHAARRPGNLKPLRCPHCQRVLNPLASLVVATRNCPGCGQRVVAEPDEPDEPLVFTLDQLDAARVARTRAQSRMCWIVLAAFLVFFGVALAAGLFRDALRDAFGPDDAAGWVLLGSMLLIGVGTTVVVVRMNTRAKRAAPKCPHCENPLYQFIHLTRLTGNCYTCGRPVADPPPDEPTGPLPTVDEYTAAEKRANRSVGASLFLTAVAFAVPGGLSAIVRPDQTAQALEPRFGELNAAIIVCALMFGWVLGLAFVAVGGIWYFARQQRRRHQTDPVLHCHRCGSEFGMATQAVASRRCPECRVRVLADPEPIGVAVPAPGG